jgi:hypothetical protein
MTLRDALDRTLLLMRDEVGDAVPDHVLIAALSDTTVALVIDRLNLASHAGQTAFITAALLMARSAHRIFLVAPEMELVGVQPPLPPGRMIAGLMKTGRQLLPDVAFEFGPPNGKVDLVVAFGDTHSDIPGVQRIRVDAEPWSGRLVTWDQGRAWGSNLWPMGALAAGALAAGEAFKAAMRKLQPYALNPAMTAAVFAPCEPTQVHLAPPGTPTVSDLGQVDFISGGAINSSALFALARLPGARLRGRVIEPDSFALSNLNRYPLMVAGHVSLGKANVLAELLGPGIRLKAEPFRYAAGSPLEPLAPQVVVGVDDIPTRWDVQRGGSAWLAIGATTHWSAMASFHAAGLGCAQCLHPEDEPGDAPIPTQACVSFWAGLLAAAYLVRRAGGDRVPLAEQHIFVTPFRPENAMGGAVAIRPECPTCGGHGVQRMRGAA